MEAFHTGVLILHVLGAAVIIGISSVTFIIELKKFTSNKQILVLTELLWKIAGPLMGLQLLTGFYLAGSEWGKISPIPYFWIKMVLFFVIGGIVGTVNKRRFEKLKAGKTDSSGTKWALLGLLTFATITALGVMIAETAA